MDARCGGGALLGWAGTRRPGPARRPDGQARQSRAPAGLGEPAQGKPSLPAAGQGDGGGASARRLVPARPQPPEPGTRLRGALLVTLIRTSEPLYDEQAGPDGTAGRSQGDRKSTRLNSSHGSISYAVFCLKK